MNRDMASKPCGEDSKTDSVDLALDTIMQRPRRGIPAWLINPMEWRIIDRIAGEPEGTYKKEPTSTYRKMLINGGCCMVDQWIPENPLTMGASGYDSDTPRVGVSTVRCRRPVRDNRQTNLPYRSIGESMPVQKTTVFDAPHPDHNGSGAYAIRRIPRHVRGSKPLGRSVCYRLSYPLLNSVINGKGSSATILYEKALSVGLSPTSSLYVFLQRMRVVQ